MIHSKSKFFLMIAIIVTASCKNDVVKYGNKKINLSDQTSIVTELDTHYLGNIVEDITKNNASQSTKQIVTNVIEKVDSVKEAATLEGTEKNSVSGTNIECKEFTATFGQLMNQSGDHYTITSFDKLQRIKIQINGILNPVVEQIYYTKLKVKIASEEFLLEDLQEYKCKPIVLQKTDNIFEGDASAMTFREVSNKNILLATDRAMRKAGKGRKELEALPTILAKTNSFTDVPCVVYASTIHYKISGTKKGKIVSEIVKISL
jgi:hypothetical protein